MPAKGKKKSIKVYSYYEIYKHCKTQKNYSDRINANGVCKGFVSTHSTEYFKYFIIFKCFLKALLKLRNKSCELWFRIQQLYYIIQKGVYTKFEPNTCIFKFAERIKVQTAICFVNTENY